MSARRSQPTAGIVGTGLIGTSAGLALRAAGWRVLGYDRSRKAASVAAGMGSIERPCSSIRSLARAVDLVLVAVPPSATVDVSRRAIDAGARAVTDVASVKGPIVRALGEMPAFLGGHPMAGSERGGPGAATVGLFRGATWVLTQTAATDPGTIGLVTAAVRATGARPLVLDAAAHDRMVAASSHMPHVVAVAQVLAVADGPDGAAIAQVLGGGWQSGTRVASGDPDLWTDILLSNRSEVIAALDVFSTEIAFIREAVRSVDAVSVHNLLQRAAHLRAALQPSATAGRAATLG